MPAEKAPRLTSSPTVDRAQLGTLTLLLGRVGRLHELLSGEVCRTRGVTLAESRALAALRGADGPLRPGVLSDRIVQTSGGLTATLRRLEEDGRIRRVDDPSDGRVKSVELTPVGAAFVDELLDATLERYATVLGDLDVDEALGVVRALLERLEAATGSLSTADWAYVEG